MQINDHQRITMLLATKDVRNLRCIISVALRNGTSISALLNQMLHAIDGKYSPRGSFSEREYAIGFLAKALGGPQLLYALSKGDKYPSVSEPSRQEISDNITMFFGASGKQAPTTTLNQSTPLLGHILMIDGVALDEVCHYDTSHNHILGLCREHSHNVNTYVTSLDIIKNIETAIHGNEKKCCHDKDATVVAIGPYADSAHYTPVPIIVSPSCKKETGEGLLQWMKTVLQTWRTHPDGQAKHGPIWGVSSDGESSFCLMQMSMCMTHVVDASSDLGHILRTMHGLNIQTGENGIVGTCDPKHVIKRKLAPH